MDRQMNEYIDGWIDELLNGWTDLDKRASLIRLPGNMNILVKTYQFCFRFQWHIIWWVVL